jgi:hypothetical protein
MSQEAVVGDRGDAAAVSASTSRGDDRVPAAAAST